jgi:hypothetical protein
LSRRLSRSGGDVLRDDGGGNKGKRGGDQKTREKVVFHLFLLKIRDAASRETAAIGKTRRSRDATTSKAVETSSRSDAIRAFLKNA